MTLTEIEKRLKALKAKGYIDSLRKGPTGIGYTFEYELGLKETNVSIPDLGGRVELKATRKNSSSLITLFTFNKGVWKISQKDLIKTYGYKDEKGRQAFYNVVWQNSANSQGLLIESDEKENLVKIMSVKTGQLIAEWSVFNLVAKFVTKFERLIFIMAHSKRNVENKEQFHFAEAYYLEKPSVKSFIKSFKNGNIGIDIRMHLKPNGSVRNHGTGIRVYESKLLSLFEKSRSLL